VPPDKPKVRGLKLDQIKPIHKLQLFEIVDAVKKDSSLDLQIRDGYVNIYYRGGSLLKISSFRGRQINFSFDVEYFKRKNGKHLDGTWVTDAPNDVSFWISNLAALKDVMDAWFEDYKKVERGDQHRLTSVSTQGSSSPWVILDIEYAAWLHGERDLENRDIGRRLCRFDMIALERANLSTSGSLIVYLVEFKQGTGAVDGRAGVIDHAEDLKQFISDKKNEIARIAFKQSVRNILEEKFELGLLPGMIPPKKDTEIELKALFLFQGIDNKEKIQRLQKSAGDILGEHGAIPLCRDSSEFEHILI
jgi:hypothetical protein